MISRVTMYSLLLGLLLAAGIWLWSSGQKDPCERFLAGDKSAPASVWVVSGTRTIEVPCSDWLMRQATTVQVFCLVDLILIVLFVLNALLDLRDQLAVWRSRRPQY